MIQNIKAKLLLIIASLFVAFPIAAPVGIAVAQDTQQQVCHGVDDLSITGGPGKKPCDFSGADNKVDKIVKQIINILSVIIGVIAVIMIVVAGFRYITSGGSSERVAGAKNTLIYALVGLVIVALAQVIAKFVLNRVT